MSLDPNTPLSPSPTPSTTGSGLVSGNDPAVKLPTGVSDHQRTVFLDWLFKPGPLHGSPSILSATSVDTLLFGLETLHQRIAYLIALDLRLYHTYVSMLSD